MDRCNELCTQETTGECALCEALAERNQFERFWFKGGLFIDSIRALKRGMMPLSDSQSDKPTTQQPLDTTSPLAQFLTEMRTYFVSNVMTTAWSVLLFAGGMIFLVYFYSIRFMPELNPQASITLLAASILTAGFLLLGITLCLFAPFVYWKIWMPSSSYKRLQALWYKDEQHAPMRAMLWVGLPFLVIVGGLFFLDSTIFKQLGISWMWGLVSLAIIVFILPIVLLFCKKLLDNPPGVLGLRTIGDLWWGFVLFFIGVVISFSVLGVIFHNIDKNIDKINMYSWYFTVALYNYLMILHINRVPLWKHFLLAIGLLFFIFLIFNLLTLIPNRVMSIYKFGNLPDASLVFDEIGCSIVQQHGMKVTPYTPNSTTAFPSTPKTCSLSKVTIHSRLGSTYYLQASRNDNTSVSFTIPAQNILSWAVNSGK